MRLADSLDSFRHKGSLLANSRLLLLTGFGGPLLMMAFADWLNDGKLEVPQASAHVGRGLTIALGLLLVVFSTKRSGQRGGS